MKSLTYKATFAVATIAIAAVGMLRDPDRANADGVGKLPAVGAMPGYQSSANVPDYEPLSADKLAKLNALPTDIAPSF